MKKCVFIVMFQVRGRISALQFYRTILLCFPLEDESKSVPENTGLSLKISKRQSGATFLTATHKLEIRSVFYYQIRNNCVWGAGGRGGRL